MRGPMSHPGPCRVSRQWVHELFCRYDAEGEAGLEPRSRRPRASPYRTPEALEDEIVELRKALLDEGLDGGAHIRRQPSAGSALKIR